MKYFTPELLARFASADSDVFAQAHDDWERALGRWNRYWRKIKHAFPEEVHRFDSERVCLHDAQVLRVAQNGETFAIIVEMEPPSQNVVILTFTLDAEPEIDTHAFAGSGETDFVTWLYEEWSLDRNQQCWFEVLLSNGWSIRLRFREFRYLLLPPILPARHESVPVAGAPAVPRSA